VISGCIFVEDIPLCL